MSQVFPGGAGDKPEPKAAPHGPWAETWALDSVSAPPPQLSEGGDSQPHIPEPQVHLLQHGTCCPASFPGGFKNLVKEQLYCVFCEQLQACVLTVSQTRQCRRSQSGRFLGPHSLGRELGSARVPQPPGHSTLSSSVPGPPWSRPPLNLLEGSWSSTPAN